MTEQKQEQQPTEQPDEHSRNETESQGESQAATEAEAGAPSIDEIKQELEQVAAERDASQEKVLRLQAELENYRKRVQKEMEQNRLYQALPLVRDLLPVLDDLHRAIAAAEQSHNVDELAEGVKMVARQFDDVLARHSATPIEAVGEPFDPNLHEAVQQVPSEEHPPMTVVQELQRGYVLNDRVVRPSKVIVSSGPPQQEQPDEDDQ